MTDHVSLRSLSIECGAALCYCINVTSQGEWRRVFVISYHAVVGEVV